MFFYSVFHFFCIRSQKGIHMGRAFYLMTLPYAIFLIRILCQTADFVSGRNLPWTFFRTAHLTFQKLTFNPALMFKGFILIWLFDIISFDIMLSIKANANCLKPFLLVCILAFQNKLPFSL